MALLTFDALHPILGVVVSLMSNAACVRSSAVHSLIGMARSDCLDHDVARQAQKKRKGSRVRASNMLGVVYLMHLALISLFATVLSLDMSVSGGIRSISSFGRGVDTSSCCSTKCFRRPPTVRSASR